MPHDVIMPALGMAQDTGLLLAWHKKPGEAVAAGDVLFEVETDKAAMEVEAQAAGYLTDIVVEAGSDVPVGDVIAIISSEKPTIPAAGSNEDSNPQSIKNKAPQKSGSVPKRAPAELNPNPSRTLSASKLLASPKAKRLANEQGLDLERLAKAGFPQPFHVSDLETLRSLSAEAPPGTVAATEVAQRVTAESNGAELADFISWLADETGRLIRRDMVLAVLAASALRTIKTGELIVRTERYGVSRTYPDPDIAGFGQVTATEMVDMEPALIVRDFIGSQITSIQLGGEAVPVLSVCGRDQTVHITLECSSGALPSEAVLELADGFARRVAEPLRTLL